MGLLQGSLCAVLGQDLLPAAAAKIAALHQKNIYKYPQSILPKSLRLRKYASNMDWSGPGLHRWLALIAVTAFHQPGQERLIKEEQNGALCGGRSFKHQYGALRTDSPGCIGV